MHGKVVTGARYRNSIATGWVKGWLYSLVFEIRNDKNGESYQMVTLWKAT
jgi:hypothetical protein